MRHVSVPGCTYPKTWSRRTLVPPATGTVYLRSAHESVIRDGERAQRNSREVLPCQRLASLYEVGQVLDGFSSSERILVLLQLLVQDHILLVLPRKDVDLLYEESQYRTRCGERRTHGRISTVSESFYGPRLNEVEEDEEGNGDPKVAPDICARHVSVEGAGRAKGRDVPPVSYSKFALTSVIPRRQLNLTTDKPWDVH